MRESIFAGTTKDRVALDVRSCMKLVFIPVPLGMGYCYRAIDAVLIAVVRNGEARNYGNSLVRVSQAL